MDTAAHQNTEPEKVSTSAAIDLLQRMISTPSFSGSEENTADLIKSFLTGQNIEARRLHNNIWAVNRHFDPAKPSLLLNSHHDTVKASNDWQRDPLKPEMTDDRLYGLGSNDAGAALVSLIAAFHHFYTRKDISHNLILAATGEEENSGAKGLKALLPELGPVDLAIVGEPTGMKLAIAEKGLIVLHCRAKGRAGHAAHENHENAIIRAWQDIHWFNTYHFQKISDLLGPVKMTVTMIHAGQQHNVVPDQCDFTVDIRTNELYTHEDILDTITAAIDSEIISSSLRLRPSHISDLHPLVHAARKIGLQTFGSATLSDQALLSCPSVKIGPGRTERSHTADEYVYLQEIEDGIHKYCELLETFLTS